MMGFNVEHQGEAARFLRKDRGSLQPTATITSLRSSGPTATSMTRSDRTVMRWCRPAIANAWRAGGRPTRFRGWRIRTARKYPVSGCCCRSARTTASAKLSAPTRRSAWRFQGRQSDGRQKGCADPDRQRGDRPRARTPARGRARLRRYHCYRHWPILPRRHLHVRFMLKHRAMRETHHPRQHRRVLALAASAPSTLQPVHYRKTAPSPTRPRPHFLVMPGTAAQQQTCRNIRIGPDMLDERPPNYHV